MMQMVGTEDTDIRMDENGQPMAGSDGDAAVAADDPCWFQDLKNEAITEEGELFYEDEEGDESYGFGLLDFLQGEYDEFMELEIQQRIRAKLQKRSYIDIGSIRTEVDYNGHDYRIRTTFKRTDGNEVYSLDIQSNGVEVIIE